MVKSLCVLKKLGINLSERTIARILRTDVPAKILKKNI